MGSSQESVYVSYIKFGMRSKVAVDSTYREFNTKWIDILFFFPKRVCQINIFYVFLSERQNDTSIDH